MHPAPGSAVPGAPPPLRRALTPADGVLVSADPAPPVEKSATQGVSPVATHSAGVAYLVAAALGGTAIGLELAAVLARRRRR
ncbi:hypothetical protein FZ046_16840 [Mycolicibacterium grossiae]|nr:hypothetical protein FZ046_16840 [Mycolicibacterium grossiae]